MGCRRRRWGKATRRSVAPGEHRGQRPNERRRYFTSSVNRVLQLPGNSAATVLAGIMIRSPWQDCGPCGWLPLHHEASPCRAARLAAWLFSRYRQLVESSRAGPSLRSAQRSAEGSDLPYSGLYHHVPQCWCAPIVGRGAVARASHCGGKLFEKPRNAIRTRIRCQRTARARSVDSGLKC
jgi:hypothetical protein